MFGNIMNKKCMSISLASLLFIPVISCSNPNLDLLNSTSDKISGANLGPQGGGAIDPKVSSGQTIINFKKGDNNLILNLKFTSTSGNFETKSENEEKPTLEKVMVDLSVNEDGKTSFEIPAEKIEEGKHVVNLIGLKSGDIVNLDAKAFDKEGNEVGKEDLEDKVIVKEIETIDINISVSVYIDSSVNVNQNVNVTQNQSVVGPTININLPSPPNNSQPSPPPINTTPPPNTSTDCLKPDINTFKITLTDGEEIFICPPPQENVQKTEGCYTPDQNMIVKTNSGKTLTICEKPQGT